MVVCIHFYDERAIHLRTTIPARSLLETLIHAGRLRRSEQMFVLQALTLHPRLVGVGEINSLAHWRVAGPPQPIHQTRSRNTEILNLELHGGGGVGVAVARDLQGEPVGFMFQVAGERQDERIEREVASAEEQQD